MRKLRAWRLKWGLLLGQAVVETCVHEAWGPPPLPLFSPQPVPVASLKFGSRVRAFCSGFLAVCLPRGWGYEGAWEETPDAGTRLGPERGC